MQTRRARRESAEQRSGYVLPAEDLYDDLLGVASIPPTERPSIGYAMIFPRVTIVKVVAVQAVGLMVATAAS